MTEKEGFLHGLCRRVAAGDAEAKQQFARDVAPLVRFIARRSLSPPQRRPAERRASDAEPPDRSASRVRDAEVMRIASRICRALIENIGKRQRRLAAETCAERRSWSTDLVPAQSSY